MVYRRAASKNAEDEKCKSIRCMEIQRLLMDKLKAERRTAYPFSALADPSANKWFTNQKSGKSIFIILFNFVYVFDNPVHVQMQLN